MYQTPPPPPQYPYNAYQDEQHLKLLTIFHYVYTGVMGFFGCMPIIHLIMGIAIVSGALGGTNGPPPEFGWMFILIAAFMMTMMWSIAVLSLIAGRKLSARRSYNYCFVVACIECAFMPFGTVLGVFTLIVLMRPSVKQLFGALPPGSAPPPWQPPATGP